MVVTEQECGRGPPGPNCLPCLAGNHRGTEQAEFGSNLERLQHLGRVRVHVESCQLVALHGPDMSEWGRK